MGRRRHEEHQRKAKSVAQLTGCIVAALTEFGFGDDAALGRSLALVGGAVTLLAALVAWRQLGGYRAAVERIGKGEREAQAAQ